LIAIFDSRVEILKDPEFGDVDVAHLESKEIQNIKFGVPGFWNKAMLANKSISSEIHEKDRPILSYLQDIVLTQHENDYGFDLIFKFEKNAYFNCTELKKSFEMKQPNSVEKAVGCDIPWKDASCDVTKTKKKKGKGKKKTTVTVKCESFFNFFETTEEVEKEDDDKDDEDDEEDENDDPNSQLQMQLQLGTTIRDDLVPLALEYYLGVIEQESDDEDGDDDDDDDEDIEEMKPKKGKKPAAGGADAPSGDKKEECKQQ